MIKLASWFDDRTGFTRMRARLEARTVASTIELHLIALGLALFVFLVASGVLLMMHYRPNAAEAHASVMRIESAVRFGALVRGVHLWSSHALVAVVGAYALALLVRRAYRPPGELVWIGALLTVLMVVTLAFSGALLSWSTQAARHANVVAGAAGEVPIIGSWLRRLLLGGADASGATLPRAFGFHVAVLPALLTVLLAVQATFVARGSTRKEAARVPLYPDALVRFATVGVGALCVVVTLATFVRPDPGQASSHAPWYLAVVTALARTMPRTVLGMSGARALVALVSMATVVLVALPFLDPRGSRLVAYLGWILFAALLAITIHALA